MIATAERARRYAGSLSATAVNDRNDGNGRPGRVFHQLIINHRNVARSTHIFHSAIDETCASRTDIEESLSAIFSECADSVQFGSNRSGEVNHWRVRPFYTIAYTHNIKANWFVPACVSLFAWPFLSLSPEPVHVRSERHQTVFLFRADFKFSVFLDRKRLRLNETRFRWQMCKLWRAFFPLFRISFILIMPNA